MGNSSFITKKVDEFWLILRLYVDGILPKGPYPPCSRMAERALLARNLDVYIPAEAISTCTSCSRNKHKATYTAPDLVGSHSW